MGFDTSQQEAERNPGIWHVLIVPLPYLVLRWAKHCLCPQEIQSCAVRTAQITSRESQEKGEKMSSQRESGKASWRRRGGVA